VSAGEPGQPGGRERKVGVDLGGTKLAVGTADGVKVIPTPATGEDIIGAVLDLAGDAVGIGVCVAGRIDLQTGTTLATHLPQLSGFPLVERLRQERRQVTLINDADAAALAEHRFGAARGTHTSLYVTVSTGIGAGLVYNDRLYQGFRGQAVELGHAGAVSTHPCPCGRIGCVDLTASGKAITQAGRALLGDPDLPGEHLALLAKSGHSGIQDIVRGAARQLAPVLANACVLFDPEAIVLGGGVVLGYGSLYLNALQEALAASLGHWCVPEIRLAELGKQSGILGALESLQ